MTGIFPLIFLYKEIIQYFFSLNIFYIRHKVHKRCVIVVRVGNTKTKKKIRSRHVSAQPIRMPDCLKSSFLIGRRPGHSPTLLRATESETKGREQLF